jgi:hypothetical protein
MRIYVTFELLRIPPSVQIPLGHLINFGSGRWLAPSGINRHPTLNRIPLPGKLL